MPIEREKYIAPKTVRPFLKKCREGCIEKSVTSENENNETDR